MDAPVTQPPSIKAPRSLVIIHTVFLEIGLVILASLWGSKLGNTAVNPGIVIAVAFISLWIITWLLKRTRYKDTSIQASVIAGLILLPSSALLLLTIAIVIYQAVQIVLLIFGHAGPGN